MKMNFVSGFLDGEALQYSSLLKPVLVVTALYISLIYILFPLLQH
jgi:hypothetical protein